jgi:hypothetical protein
MLDKQLLARHIRLSVSTPGKDWDEVVDDVFAIIAMQGFVVVPRHATAEMVANALPIEDEPSESEMAVGREAVRLLSGGDNGPEQDVLGGQMARDWALMIATSPAQGD